MHCLYYRPTLFSKMRRYELLDTCCPTSRGRLFCLWRRCLWCGCLRLGLGRRRDKVRNMTRCGRGVREGSLGGYKYDTGNRWRRRHTRLHMYTCVACGFWGFNSRGRRRTDRENKVTAFHIYPGGRRFIHYGGRKAFYRTDVVCRGRRYYCKFTALPRKCHLYIRLILFRRIQYNNVCRPLSTGYGS